MVQNKLKVKSQNTQKPETSVEQPIVELKVEESKAEEVEELKVEESKEVKAEELKVEESKPAEPKVKKTVKKSKAKADVEVKPESTEPVELIEPTEVKGGKKLKTKTKKSKSQEPTDPVETIEVTEKKVKKTKKVKTDEQEPEQELEDDNKTRSFKVQLPTETDFTGRFTGLTPYQAANKALSKYFRNNDNVNINGEEIIFNIKESTRGSKRSTYAYTGKRIKLTEPIQYKIKASSGEERIIVKQYKNHLTKIKKGFSKVESEPVVATTTI
jgi:hypothetical protein